jgi:general secretion pathway protein A
LINRQTRVRVPRRWLENSWSGEYRLLWRSGVHSVLQPGDSGDDVAELDRVLAAALGATPLRTRRFDMALKQRTEAFQRWQGLSVDGVVGRQTLRELYRITDSDAPELQPVQTVVSDNTPLAYPSPVPLVALSALKPEQPTSLVAAELVLEPTKVTDARLTDSGPDQQWQLEQLDLSELSPELALKVESALQSDYTGQTEEPPVVAEPKTVKLEERQSELRGRLPAMNLQTHMYSSSADGRWVKINGQELHEGDWLDGRVQLLRISPRDIMIRFDGMQVEIPALYEWQG